MLGAVAAVWLAALVVTSALLAGVVAGQALRRAVPLPRRPAGTRPPVPAAAPREQRQAA